MLYRYEVRGRRGHARVYRVWAKDCWPINPIKGLDVKEAQ